MGGVPGRPCLTAGRDLEKTRILLPMILDTFHRPVLLPKVIELLNIRKGSNYIDATVGGGGYALEIYKLGGHVLGIDLDEAAVRQVREKNKEIILFRGNFSRMDDFAAKTGFKEVAGIIFDLGLSSYQLDKSGRGFSYKRDEPLDMRFDNRAGLTARDIINNYSKALLYEIFTKNAEELHSRTIADAIVRTRTLKGAISSTFTLRDIVIKAVTAGDQKGTHKILTRIFQAVRMEVNREMENLESGLTKSVNLLTKEGRLIVISFHSLEDRLIKNFFKNESRRGRVKILTGKAQRATWQEIKINSRAKSAKLRALEKL